MTVETLTQPETLTSADRYKKDIESLIRARCPIDRIGAYIMRIYTHTFSELSEEQYAEALASLDLAMREVMINHPELFGPAEADNYALGAHTELTAINLFRSLGFSIDLPTDTQDRIDKTDLLITLGTEKYAVQTKNLALKVGREEAKYNYPEFPVISRIESFDDLLVFLENLENSFGATHSRDDILINWNDTSAHQSGSYDLTTLNRAAIDRLLLTQSAGFTVEFSHDSTYVGKSIQIEKLATAAIHLYGSRLRLTNTEEQPLRLMCVINGNTRRPEMSDYDFRICRPTRALALDTRSSFITARKGTGNER